MATTKNTADSRIDALEAGMAQILAALQANTAPAAKPEPTTRKAVQSAKRDRVNATTAKAKAAGTHRTLKAGATSPHREEEIGEEGHVVRFDPRNVNGVRASILNAWGKPNRSLTRDHVAFIAENAEAILAVFDEVEEEAGIGAFREEDGDE